MSLKDIRIAVEQVTGVDLMEQTRKRPNVDARYIYFHIARMYGVKNIVLIDGEDRYISYSLTEIGKSLNKDHATVIHGCNSVDNLLKTDKEFRLTYIKCEEIIKEGVNPELFYSNVKEFKLVYDRKKEETIREQQEEINRLKRELRESNKGESELIKTCSKVPYHLQEELLSTRIKPFLKLKGSEVEPKVVIPISGAKLRI